MQLGITVGGLALAVTLAYGGDLYQIFSDAFVFSSGNIGNYIIAIPPMAGLILYRKRSVFAVSITLRDSHGWWSFPLGLSLIGCAIFLYLYGTSTLYALNYHIYSLVLFLAGAILVLFNYTTLRHAFFVLVLFAFLEPLPGELIGSVAADISWLTSLVLEDSFKAIGMGYQLDTNLGAPSFLVTRPDGQQSTFVIGEPSSGVFSIIGISVFALFVAYVSSGSVWKRVVLFVFSLPLFFILNAARIGAIISIWYFANQNSAEVFHMVGGILMAVVGTLLLLVLGEKALHIPLARKNLQRLGCSHCQQVPSSNEEFCTMCGRLLIRSNSVIRLSTILLTVLIIGSGIAIYTVSVASFAVQATGGLESLDLTKVKGPEAARYMLPNAGGMTPVFAYRDTATEMVLNQDLALAFRYENTSGQEATLPVYVGIQISNGLHSWEDSLISYPSSIGRPAAKTIKLEDISLTPTKTARFFMYQRAESNSTEAVLYWFERMPFSFGSHYESRNVFIVLWSYTDNLANRGLVNGPGDTSGTERYLASLGAPISNHWDKLKANSLTFTLLNDFAIRNAPLIFTLIFVSFGLYVVFKMIGEFRAARQYKRIFADLAVPEERAIVIAASSGKPKSTNGAAIEAEFRSQLGTAVPPSTDFVSLLKKARDAGFLRNEIAVVDDVPMMIWASKLDSIFGRIGSRLKNKADIQPYSANRISYADPSALKEWYL